MIDLEDRITDLEVEVEEIKTMLDEAVEIMFELKATNEALKEILVVNKLTTEIELDALTNDNLSEIYHKMEQMS